MYASKFKEYSEVLSCNYDEAIKVASYYIKSRNLPVSYLLLEP